MNAGIHLNISIYRNSKCKTLFVHFFNALLALLLKVNTSMHTFNSCAQNDASSAYFMHIILKSALFDLFLQM